MAKTATSFSPNVSARQQLCTSLLPSLPQYCRILEDKIISWLWGQGVPRVDDFHDRVHKQMNQFWQDSFTQMEKLSPMTILDQQTKAGTPLACLQPPWARQCKQAHPISSPLHGLPTEGCQLTRRLIVALLSTCI